MLQWEGYGGHVKDVCIFGKIFTLGLCLTGFNQKLIWYALSSMNGNDIFVIVK